jgi:hypothetical protein
MYIHLANAVMSTYEFPHPPKRQQAAIFIAGLSNWCHTGCMRPASWFYATYEDYKGSNLCLFYATNVGAGESSGMGGSGTWLIALQIIIELVT